MHYSEDQVSIDDVVTSPIISTPFPDRMRTNDTSMMATLSPQTIHSVREGRIRRKMRKGTHSCIECRRRKIRCIFNPQNPTVCSECFARGSKCIDQEHAEPGLITDQRKNLRERVARLESLIETLLDERDQFQSQDGYSRVDPDSIPLTPHSDPGELFRSSSSRPPLMSFFENSIWSRTDDARSASSGTSPSPVQTQQGPTSFPSAQSTPVEPRSAEQHGQTATSKIKNHKVLRALIAALPPPDKLKELLDKNTKLWEHMQMRLREPGSNEEILSLEAYMNKALQEENPLRLARVVQSVAGSLEDDQMEKLLLLIDKLIVYDDEYMGTFDGLEVALIQGRLFTDMGQARRAWLSFRRGMTFLELIGLHRTRVSFKQDFLFWAYFQADRLSSVMLGTPYYIRDSHCNLTFRPKNDESGPEGHGFMTGIAMIVSKVIDRTHAAVETSYQSVLDLDAELEAFAAKLPAEYWKQSPTAPTNTMQAFKWMGALLGQAIYFQVKIFLHTPYMLKSASNPGYTFSRDVCFETARRLLAVFKIIRAPENAFMYKCTAVDFIGFVGAITLVLGLLGYGDFEPEQAAADWDLLENIMQLFASAADRPFGKIAAESHKALQQLIQYRHPVLGQGEPDVQKVVIPFYGTITVQRGQMPKRVDGSQNRSLQDMYQPSAASHSAAAFQQQHHHHQQQQQEQQHQQGMAHGMMQGNNAYYPMGAHAAYEGPFTNYSATLHARSNNGNGGGYMGPASPWMPANRPGSFDLDHDWSWLTNDFSAQQTFVPHPI